MITHLSRKRCQLLNHQPRILFLCYTTSFILFLNPFWTVSVQGAIGSFTRTGGGTQSGAAAGAHVFICCVENPPTVGDNNGDAGETLSHASAVATVSDS